MKRIGNKGFALVETLVVAMFVMTIFSLVYTNFFPMIGEYEKREKYDDIDSVYNTFLIKRMLEDPSTKTGNYNTIRNEANAGYGDLNRCNFLFSDPLKVEYCTRLYDKLKIDKVYLTRYNLTTMKSRKSSLDSYMADYLDTLPNYTKPAAYSYRIVVKFKHDVNDESSNVASVVYSFATMGVDF